MRCACVLQGRERQTEPGCPACREWAPDLEPAIANTLVAARKAIESLGQQAADGGEDGGVSVGELMYLGEAGVLSAARLLQVRKSPSWANFSLL